MDFARVLLVGVVILAVLLVLFGDEFGGFGGGEEGGPGYTYGPVNVSTGEEEGGGEPGEEVAQAFWAGRKRSVEYKHFSLSEEPFSVSFMEEPTKLGYINETTVKKGFLMDEPQVIRFNLTEDQVEKVTSTDFSFRVEDTNSFGRLYVNLNGEQVYSGFPKPEKSYSFEANESILNKTNGIRIHAGSSGGKFWAPTTYILKDFTAKASVLGREEETFTFSLTKDQANNFRSGRLILYPKKFKANQPLVVQVNGGDIYRKTTEEPGRPNLWIDFDEADIYQGSNEITMFTNYSSSYSFKSARLIIFWTSGKEKMTSRTLDVSSSQYGKLPGEISFDIDRIEGDPTSLNLKVITPDGQENKVLIQDVLKEGKTVSVDITKDDLYIGDNEIRFIVEGEGGFYLSDFKVKY